jgi:RecA-family ATPase
VNAAAAHQRPCYGVLSLPEFERLCAAQPSAQLVEGLIPEASVCIAVGDSGLGKSAWAYQLGMCVASGKPFLDHPVKQGRVLYIDLENGREGIIGVTRALLQHLGIAQPMEDFCLLAERDNLHLLDSILMEHRPALVIVDSLRAFRPDAEEKPRLAASLLNEMRDIAKKRQVSFLLIHHIKKPSENGVPALEDSQPMTSRLAGRVLSSTSQTCGLPSTVLRLLKRMRK